MKNWTTTFSITFVVATLMVASTARAQQPSIYTDPNQSVIDPSQMPQVAQGRFQLPALQAPSTRTDNVGNGRTPEGFRGQDHPVTVALPESGDDRVAGWGWSVRQWAAPNTFSNPRYFEDRMLERHGHQRWGWLQPVVSGGRFVAAIPMWPYLATVRNPFDCEYSLGYFRSGTCAPAMLQRPPFDQRAVLVEAAAVTGVVAAFP